MTEAIRLECVLMSVPVRGVLDIVREVACRVTLSALCIMPLNGPALNCVLLVRSG